ncbi:MAG TPA: hypothetical protein VJZ68_01260 [Nitrososphaera sp.]|nr:hypothetical protein [Nitrososphaera sp.]
MKLQEPTTRLAIIAIAAAVALLGVIAISAAQSADAWHELFVSKKECVNFMKSQGNTTAQAQFMCNKVVPH